MAQPDGLVVTTTALKNAEANITWPVIELQTAIKALVDEKTKSLVIDPKSLLQEILGWSDDFLVDRERIPDSLRVPLDGGEYLSPHFAVRSADEPDAFVLLVGQPDKWKADLDAASDSKRWTATPHQKFERLLRETGVNVGLLMNAKVFRLVYAPKGESAGWITFRLSEMLSVDGRPLLGAFHMLLNERRLLSLESESRLLGLLKASREYQNTVSKALREQVLSALRDLMRGLERADQIAGGSILKEYRQGHLNQVYLGLVTVLMRMVFILFAEERSLLPMENDLYASSYSLSRLYAQLSEDWARYGEGIDDRYGAWARVLVLFRLLHDGVAAVDGLSIPRRKGDLFDPEVFPFLEGRSSNDKDAQKQGRDLPRVSDGAVFRALSNLVMLHGERLQYRGLDVEQIGSVYEGLLGYNLEVADGPSLCVTPDHVVVNLEHLLKQSGAERLKTLKCTANLDLKEKAGAQVKEARTIGTLQEGLAKRNSSTQPGLIAKGSLFLQPGEERRRSGGHYTPKSLTSPIVETALRPILERLGPNVTPEQILDLKVCDPAMGSGAFLVEACRQLADQLVAAWRRTDTMPELPADEDPILHARRLVAQRCLYGVDKNHLAVNLARLALWLATFAKQHPFTFVDHALREGDSLVGLTREQIASLSLNTGAGKQVDIARPAVMMGIQNADELRQQIHALGDPPDNDDLEKLWKRTNESLDEIRLFGDALISSFFAADSDKARDKATNETAHQIADWLMTGQGENPVRKKAAALRQGDRPIAPFHWEVEFPEVFIRQNPGFDSFFGNPPFAGKNTLIDTCGDRYLDWLKTLHTESHGNADLVAHFFRRAFALLREQGTFGLIATNTIAQGDTRGTGLRWILHNGGEIYNATRRCRWPHEAAVVVSIVAIQKKPVTSPAKALDKKTVEHISAFLFHAGGDDNPVALIANANKSFQGSIVLGMGFTFDDSNLDKGSSTLAEMRRIIASNPRNQERIFPYIGGEELNTSPIHSHHRYVINFSQVTEEEARRWPDLIRIVESKVKPDRLKQNREVRAKYWWRFGEVAPALYQAIRGMSRVLVCSRVQHHWCITPLQPGPVFSEATVVFAIQSQAGLGVLQSRLHETWTRFFASSMKDDIRYTPSDCFETYPFPPSYETNRVLEDIGEKYYQFRAALMVKNNEGLTKTYNRFHNPDEHSPDIKKLRDLHAEMDRAVLNAYGWNDIQPVCDFREQLDESIRLTWDEDTRDEVLARLLELNRVMAEKESEASALSKGPVRASPKGLKKASHKEHAQPAEVEAPRPKRRAANGAK